ncbi:hypothetical protein, partial [Pandoraea sputorum]|uniref:hypothetical protein n=1 Tax=Pandoraea sputorum TaxID=93222 RepID=UPI0035586329
MKDQGYPLSDQYHIWSHENKAGVIVFIRAIINWSKSIYLEDEAGLGEPLLRSTDDPGRPAIEIVLPVKGAEIVLRPRPPLDIRSQGGTSLKDVIGSYLRSEVNKGLAAEIKAAIKVRANERNRLLYARDEG